MKKTLLYLAILCFTAAFSQTISNIITGSSASNTNAATPETYNSYITYRANLKKKKQEEKKLYTPATAKQLKNYKFGDYLIVTSKAAVIMKGAGSDFNIVQTVKQDGLLKFDSYQGHWIKVTTVDSGLTGYIHYKDIK
jgi:hypothetical protein